MIDSIPIRWSRGASITDNQPVQREAATFDEFVASLDADRALDKASAPYVCGPLNGSGRRCAEGSLPRRWIALDLDRIKADRLPDVRLWFTRFSGCAWPTHSSKPGAPRERVLIELDRDATRDEGVAIGAVLADDLRAEFGDDVELDPSTHRAEQASYVPPTAVQIARFDGDPLDVDAYLAAAQEHPQDAPEPPTSDDRTGGKVPAGQRNETLSREAFRLRKQGLSVEAIEPVLHALNRARCAPPLPDAEVAQIARGKAKIQPDADAGAGGERDVEPADDPDGGVVLHHFYAYMPTHTYLFAPTRELWPAVSLNARLPWPKVGDKPIAPAAWLDRHRPIEQMVWHPGERSLIADRVMQVSGWARHAGAKVFNLYRPPERPRGDAAQAGRWVEHVRRVYPDDADQIIRWLAFKIQNPGEKVNHALVLGGSQGIGKDTLLEPVKAAVGPWNWSDISPTQMLGRFNGWVRAVIVRINEARDLGEVDRFAFYDHAKTLTAAPPDVLRVDEKHLRETYCANVCGVIYTTNHASDGLYLPADDRRHYVAWSPRKRENFAADYWTSIYRWFADGGIGHVVAYLAAFDLAGFDPKAPPPKTPAFWSIVATSEAPESGELRDVLDNMQWPNAVTLAAIADRAKALKMFDFADELVDRKTRRTVPHKLERVGYVPVRNPDADDGLFKTSSRRVAVYAKRALPLPEQVRAARRVA